jgi:hypothetical protein
MGRGAGAVFANATPRHAGGGKFDKVLAIGGIGGYNERFV